MGCAQTQKTIKRMKHFIRFLAMLVLTAGLNSFGQDTNAPSQALQNLVHKIQAKIKAGKTTEADLKDELGEFDQLIADQKGAKTEAAAQMVYMKATLYIQVFGETSKGEQILKQMQADYPDTTIAKKSGHIISALEEQEKLANGMPFPDFAETDLEGKPISVGGFKGKVVLVDFWATWCGPCRGELPNVIATYKKHHADGFEIIGVSLDSDRDKLETFLKQTDGMTWQQYFDGQGWSNKLAVKYGVDSIPFAILVGPDGRIIGKSLRGEDLENAVAGALAKK
jgi:thiol-disulfide isomerase/thioredoxin